MAVKKRQRKQPGGILVAHKLGAAVALLVFFVVAASTLQVDAPLDSIVILILWRGFLAMVVVKAVFYLVVKILKTHEEMNGGET